MSTLKKWVMAAVVIIMVIVLMIALTDKHSDQDNQQMTITVKRETLKEQAVAIGYIVPKHFTTVKSQLSGIVGAVYADAGDYVKKGEKLLRVDPNPDLNAYAQALAAVKEDQANLLGYQNQVKNYQYLAKNHIINANYNDYLNAKQQYQVAQAKLKLDEQQLDLLEKGNAVIGGALRKSIVNSPIEGYILQRSVDVGDPVISVSDQQAATILYTIANMNDLIFKGTVDETDAGKLKENMPADITVGALPNEKITGHLSTIALQSDQQNQITNPNDNTNSAAQSNSPFNVGFQVDINQLKMPKNSRLRSGYSATAEITIKTAKNALVIPERVLIFREGKSYVKLPNKAGNAPKLQAIKTGISNGIDVQVLSGLSENEKVLDLQPTSTS